jgi:hypothetical protein
MRRAIAGHPAQRRRTVVAVLVSGFTGTVRAGDRPAGATSSGSDDAAPAARP